MRHGHDIEFIPANQYGTRMTIKVDGKTWGKTQDWGGKDSATAQLFTAAPEMYAVLRRTRAALLQLATDTGHTVDRDTLLVIDAAINRADGRP